MGSGGRIRWEEEDLRRSSVEEEVGGGIPCGACYGGDGEDDEAAGEVGGTGTRTLAVEADASWPRSRTQAVVDRPVHGEAWASSGTCMEEVLVVVDFEFEFWEPLVKNLQQQ